MTTTTQEPTATLATPARVGHIDDLLEAASAALGLARALSVLEGYSYAPCEEADRLAKDLLSDAFRETSLAESVAAQACSSGNHGFPVDALKSYAGKICVGKMDFSRLIRFDTLRDAVDFTLQQLDLHPVLKDIVHEALEGQVARHLNLMGHEQDDDEAERVARWHCRRLLDLAGAVV